MSQHLRVLERAKLVRSEVQGRRTIVALDPVGFESAATRIQTLWPEALARFQKLAEESWK